MSSFFGTTSTRSASPSSTPSSYSGVGVLFAAAMLGGGSSNNSNNKNNSNNNGNSSNGAGGTSTTTETGDRGDRPRDGATSPDHHRDPDISDVNARAMMSPSSHSRSHVHTAVPDLAARNITAPLSTSYSRSMYVSCFSFLALLPPPIF